MPKKVKEVIAILEDNGWPLARQSAGHRTYKHPDHALLVTVSGSLEQHAARRGAGQHPSYQRAR